MTDLHERTVQTRDVHTGEEVTARFWVVRMASGKLFVFAAYGTLTRLVSEGLDFETSTALVDFLADAAQAHEPIDKPGPWAWTGPITDRVVTNHSASELAAMTEGIGS